MKQDRKITVCLWIDDLREPPDRNWFWAQNSKRAIALMREIQFDVISFDHDLGGDDTAMKVIDFLEHKFYIDHVQFHFEWFIHSANPVGRENLHRALNRLFAMMEYSRLV